MKTGGDKLIDLAAKREGNPLAASQTILFEKEHPVWKIEDKSLYPLEVHKQKEEIFDFLANLVDTVGFENSEKLFNLMREEAWLSYRILGMLVLADMLEGKE